MFDFASRIAKLDAISLDKEFLSFLRREVTEVVIAVTGEEWLQRCSPEISLFIKFIIWKFTTSSTGRTIGQRLLGVKYGPDSGKLRLLFMLEGVIPYIVERLRYVRHVPGMEDVNIRRPLKYAENIFKIFHVVNFCAFLIQNRYPTVATRILRLPIVPVEGRYNPAAGYSYQIRELLWHQFADLLITILPMINFMKMKRSVVQWWNGAGQRSLSSNSEDPRQVLKCVVCNEDAVLPQRRDGEVHCYFCFQAVMADDART